MKEYIFVGGTAGFDALRDGDLFEELLRTGRVGLYQHANAIDAAQEDPGLLQDIQRVFHGTGHGQAELGQVGWNYFTLPPSYGYYQSQYLQNGLSPSEANVNFFLNGGSGPGYERFIVQAIQWGNAHTRIR